MTTRVIAYAVFAAALVGTAHRADGAVPTRQSVPFYCDIVRAAQTGDSADCDIAIKPVILTLARAQRPLGQLEVIAGDPLPSPRPAPFPSQTPAPAPPPPPPTTSGGGEVTAGKAD